MLIKIIPVRTDENLGSTEYCTPYQISGMCGGQVTLRTDRAGLLRTADDRLLEAS